MFIGILIEWQAGLRAALVAVYLRIIRAIRVIRVINVVRVIWIIRFIRVISIIWVIRVITVIRVVRSCTVRCLRSFVLQTKIMKNITHL